MRFIQRFSLTTRNRFLPASAGIAAISIFIADTLTDLEIAVAALYVIVILLSVGFSQRRGILLIGAGCILLTTISFMLTRAGAQYSGVINCLISIFVITATTYLVLKIEEGRKAAQDAQTQIEHIARVTTLSELATSIAHEVNQPLTAIVNSSNACLRWLANEPSNSERAKQAVRRVIEDANRASGIIDRVRNMAKRSPPHREALRVSDAVLETLALCRAEIERTDIVVRTEWPADLPLVEADPVQLQQVLLNLILNGLESINRAGAGPRELLIQARPSGAEDLQVAIFDSGAGLDQQSLDRMFDAFYTTKQDGMGLGLTISRSIVEAHGGRLWAARRQPRGAAILFTLPCGGDARS